MSLASRWLPDDEWGRDVAQILVGWLLASALAIVLLFTVVRWAFV